MSTVSQTLKYLWTAIFVDGTEIEQPADDRYSKHDDSAEGNPSAFRDVLDKEKESKLIMFYLTNTETGDKVGVDLETGQFAINGVAFDAHSQFLDLSNKELKIVFHREVRREQTMGVNDWEEKDYTEYVSRYFIGWQIIGEDTVQTIAVG